MSSMEVAFELQNFTLKILFLLFQLNFEIIFPQKTFFLIAFQSPFWHFQVSANLFKVFLFLNHVVTIRFQFKS